MRIAVVGSGVSGLVVARLLATKYDVQLFEAGDYPGGHANTVDVDLDGQSFAVDTGFMVFNERTYPNFIRLLKLLGISTQPSDMSFSVSCEASGLEYQGSSLNGLFASAAILSVHAFIGCSPTLCDLIERHTASSKQGTPRLTLREFLARHGFGNELRDRYLLPMTAAIWSCPPENVLDFPARFLLQFMQNHGLLQLTDRPQWLTIPGGSRRYVEALTARLGCETSFEHPRLSHQSTRRPRACGILKATRRRYSTPSCSPLTRTHRCGCWPMSDQLERELLSAFPYQRNEAVLHTDESWLPRRRAAWASWNYRITHTGGTRVCVTYDLSRLQNVNSPRRLLVTLNPSTPIAAEHVLRRFTYHHPVFSQEDGRRASAVATDQWPSANVLLWCLLAARFS